MDELRPRTRSPEVAEPATSRLPSLIRPSDVPPWCFHLGRPFDGSARKLRPEVAFPLARFSPIRPDACHADVTIPYDRPCSQRCSTRHPCRQSERRSNARIFMKHGRASAQVVNYTDVAIGAHAPGSRGALTSPPPAWARKPLAVASSISKANYRDPRGEPVWREKLRFATAAGRFLASPYQRPGRAVRTLAHSPGGECQAQ